MSVTMDLGKVGVLYKGEHDSTQTYERNDIVMSNGSGYIAKQNVPVGVNISNTTYWGTVVVGADSNVFATKAYTASTYATISDVSALQAAVGSPLVANAVADMTDTEKVYVYTGSETGYTSGNWYYYNGSAWVSGGTYNSQGIGDGTITTAKLADGAVTDAKLAQSRGVLEKVAVLFDGLGGTMVTCINLLDVSAMSQKKVINSDGSLADNDYRWTTGYIPFTVEDGGLVITNYIASITPDARRGRSCRAVALYNSSKQFISGSYWSGSSGKDVISPVEGVAYARMSFVNTDFDDNADDTYKMQIEYGTSNVGKLGLDHYVKYFAPYAVYSIPHDFVQGLRKRIEINATDGIDSFYQKMTQAFTDGDCDVYIGKGNYTYTNEFVDSIRSHNKRGVPIGNGCRYFFETGARIYCEYTGDNASDVVNYFSPLDSQNVSGDFEIYNLDLVAKNTCYALHDEADGAGSFCKHIYKDCYIELDNTALGNSGNSISKALGGGLGKYEEVIIENCVFKATNPSKTSTDQDDASYHGANGSTFTDAKLIVSGCYFENRFRTSDLPANVEAPYPKIIFTGNSSGVNVTFPNTWTTKVWNNEKR